MSRKCKAVMLGWGEISHSEMERLLFVQRDNQFVWRVFRQLPVFGFTNQGIQEALRSHICGGFFRGQDHNQTAPTQ
ncbi:hypothetical protein HMPREF1609_00957 [Escherichia coli 908541]|nr:hypothetical protein HMPREF1609_00957 [Escherichia coli 908541]